MDRRRWVDIVKNVDFLIFIDLLRRNQALRNLAKQAIWVV
jgi:hypothetical protein